MFNKLVFDITPYQSVRVWMYFNESDFHKVKESKESKGFDYLCSWGGADKREVGLMSWEFDTCLIPFFVNKYSQFPVEIVDVEVLRKIINIGMKKRSLE